MRSWEGSNLAYNQNGPRQILVDWIHGTGKTSTAFDFPTKGILQVSCPRNLLRQNLLCRCNTSITGSCVPSYPDSVVT